MTEDIVKKISEWGTPVFEELGLTVYDIELAGGKLLVSVDREGGVGLDEVARCTRGLSAILDERDPIPGRYTLEVSSPGLERRLRTVAHRRAAVGEKVKCKSRDADGVVRRTEGLLCEADDEVIVIDAASGPVRIPHDEVISAKTVFVWPAAGKPERAKAEDKKRRAKQGDVRKATP